MNGNLRFSDRGLHERMTFASGATWDAFTIIGPRLNLAYFMDITGAGADGICGADRTFLDQTVAASTRRSYAGQTEGLINVVGHERRIVVAPNRVKGNALAGVKIVMADNTERRQFRLVGAMRDLTANLIETANVQFWLYAERGSRICIPAAEKP